MSGLGSRLHRIGSVFSRCQDLLKTNAMSAAEKPLWFDVYEAFPPVREPIYKPDTTPDEFGDIKFKDTVRPIFYPEDWAIINASELLSVSSGFSKNVASLFDSYTSPKTNFVQEFAYNFRIELENDPSLSKEEAFKITENKLSNKYILLKSSDNRPKTIQRTI